MQLRHNDQVVINKLSAGQTAMHEHPSAYDWQLAFDGNVLDQALSKRVLVINKLSINLHAGSSRRHPAILMSFLRDKLNSQTERFAQQALHVSDCAAHQAPAVYFNDHVEWIVSFIADKYKGEQPWYWQSIEENNLPASQSIYQTLCNNSDYLGNIIDRLIQKSLAAPIFKLLSDTDIQQILFQLKRSDALFDDTNKSQEQALKNSKLSGNSKVGYVKYINAVTLFRKLLKQCLSNSQINQRTTRCEIFIELFATLIYQSLPSQLKQVQAHQDWLSAIEGQLYEDENSLSHRFDSFQNLNKNTLKQLQESRFLAAELIIFKSLDSQLELRIADSIYHNLLGDQDQLSIFSDSAFLYGYEPAKRNQLWLHIKKSCADICRQEYKAQRISAHYSHGELIDTNKVSNTQLLSRLSKASNNRAVSQKLSQEQGDKLNIESKGRDSIRQTQEMLKISESMQPAFAQHESEFYTSAGGIFYLLHLLANPRCQALINEENLNPWQCIYYLCCHFDVSLDATVLTFFKDQLQLENVSEFSAMPALSIKAQYLLPIYLFEQFSRSRELFSALLNKRARVTLFQRHLDVFFHTSAIDINARLSGLDINPGWVPSIEMVINFHYQDDSYLLENSGSGAAPLRGLPDE